MNKRIIVLLGCTLILMLSACVQQLLRVPERYLTIQRAIDRAIDGDVIIVSPGTYKENIDFKGKNLTVQSSNPDDPDIVASTIIDGGGKGSVVTFQSGETREAADSFVPLIGL